MWPTPRWIQTVSLCFVFLNSWPRHWWKKQMWRKPLHHHHRHHVPEELGVFSVPWSSIWSWSFHLFFGRPMFLRPFGLYCSACFGILFVSILFTCCSHFSWYCFISFTMFCAPVFPLLHSFFSLSNFVIPSKCLKNFICAASKRCSSLFFSTQASLPNFNAALAVMLWILNFVSLFICFPKCLRIAPFILLYDFYLSSKSLLNSDKRYPKYLTLILLTWIIWWAPNNANKWQMWFNSAFRGLKSVTCSIMLSFITIFTHCMYFPTLPLWFCFCTGNSHFVFSCYKV